MKAETAATGARTPETFVVRDRRSDEVCAELPVLGPDEVRGMLERARGAQRTWWEMGTSERGRCMRAVAEALAGRQEELTERIVAETGKPGTEALAEVVVCADLIRYYDRVAPALLRPKKAGTSWMVWKSARIEREPHGVIGAITPWNYPLVLAMDLVTTALYGGNGVLLKPSEYTPYTALLLPEIFAAAGVPEHLLQVATGYGATGEAVVRSGVDKVFFIGGSETGRKVAAAAVDRLTPVSLELGGKDPAIVLGDADVERASRGVVFGGFFNSGQTCISIERVFVEESIADDFIEAVVERVGGLRQGIDGEIDLGPMVSGPQADIVDRHIQDALARGGRALTGGTREGLRIPPTVLVDVDDSMEIMREETFGPVLPIVRVQDEDEAVRRANSIGYGLFASVWTGDTARGLRIARKLRVGGVSINDSLSHYGIAALPMGGVGESGSGRRRGVVGLEEMTRTRSILIDRGGRRSEPWWFPYTPGKRRLFRAILAWRGNGGLSGLARGVRTLFTRDGDGRG